MAGTLTISTLSDGTNSTSATNCIRGSAKAWVNFAGASGAIAGSFNVSSVTRTTTGYYTINITTAMPNANYSIGAQSTSWWCCINSGTLTTTAFGVQTFQGGSFGSYDSTQIYAQVFSN